MARGRYLYEDAPEHDGKRYMVKGWRGVAWFVRGAEIERAEVWIDDATEEDPENGYWDTEEQRSGMLVMTMVGDDSQHLVDAEDITELTREEYCGECGQIGCTHDGYERE
jgi:hypothetical protein